VLPGAVDVIVVEVLGLLVVEVVLVEVVKVVDAVQYVSESRAGVGGHLTGAWYALRIVWVRVDTRISRHTRCYSRPALSTTCSRLVYISMLVRVVLTL
jgi:hypothetical protein